MASEEEKAGIINFSKKYCDVEWPWNKLSIAKERKQVREFIEKIDSDTGQDNPIISMMTFHELITNELMTVYGSSGHYDPQDGGRLSAVLLVIDNFIENPKKEIAITLHELIMKLDPNIYVPGFSKYEGTRELEDNIYNDVRFIHDFLDDWCFVSGYKDLY